MNFFDLMSRRLALRRGVWEELFSELCGEEKGGSLLMLDSTVVRAHACAARAKKITVLSPWAEAGEDFRQSFMRWRRMRESLLTLRLPPDKRMTIR